MNDSIVFVPVYLLAITALIPVFLLYIFGNALWCLVLAVHWRLFQGKPSEVSANRTI